MLSSEFPFNSEDFPEDGEFVAPPSLSEVIEDQFQLALQLEWIEDAKGPRASKGRYFKHVILPVGPDQTRHSVRIVMKQPHPDDEPGTYTEIFKLPPKLDDELEELPQQYVLRSFVEERPGPFWLTSEDTIFRLDERTNDFVPFIPEDPLQPYEMAAEVCELLADQHIVSSTE